MNNIIGGHEAEMDALADLEASAEARSIRLRFAARDLIAAAVTLNEIANGCWEPGLPDLFGETKTEDQARQRNQVPRGKRPFILRGIGTSGRI